MAALDDPCPGHDDAPVPAVNSVAVLGLGRMGAPIASRIARAGFAVTGYDPTGRIPDDVEPAGSPTAAVAHADVVLTVLPGSPELRALLVADGLLEQFRRGSVWIDCTSTSPDVAQDLLARASAAGVEHLDCALGGGPSDAAAGTLTLYLGGCVHVVSRCRPVLGPIAGPDRVHHVGGSGQGTLAKLLINLLWFGQATLVAEALLLARASGIEADALAALLPVSPAASAFVSTYLPGLLRGDYMPSFGLSRVVEELDGLHRLAHVHGTPFEVSDVVARVHRDALERFGPGADGELLAVAHLEALAGFPLTGPGSSPEASAE